MIIISVVQNFYQIHLNWKNKFAVMNQLWMHRKLYVCQSTQFPQVSQFILITSGKVHSFDIKIIKNRVRVRLEIA